MSLVLHVDMVAQAGGLGMHPPNISKFWGLQAKYYLEGVKTPKNNEK